MSLSTSAAAFLSSSVACCSACSRCSRANSASASDKAPTRALCAETLRFLDELTGVLGLLYGGDEADDGFAEKVESLIAQRAEARKAKNWAEADRIRDEIKAMGVILEDTPQGAKWKKA